MAVGWTWLKNNVGLEAPDTDGGVLGAPLDEERLQAEIISFDSEAPEGDAFLLAAPGANGLSKFVDIAWPADLAPQPGKEPTGSSLPKCDVLIATWTVEEGH